MGRIFRKSDPQPLPVAEEPERLPQPAELLALLKTELPTEEYLKALFREFHRLYEHCQARKTYYQCHGEVEQAVRFEQAAKWGLAFVTTAKISFAYEREHAARTAMEKEIAAARANFPGL